MVRMRESILPDDLIKEILSRTPARSVLRFRSICKAWKNLISEPFFINLHLTRSLQRGPMHIILVHDMAPVSVFLLDTEKPSNMSVCHSEKAAFNYAIGSCHGLVCTRISPHRKCIYLWNASTRKEMSFPYHTKFKNYFDQEMSYGFFYDPTCCAYKFLTVKKRKGSRFSSKVRLYSVDNREGKLIGDIPFHVLPMRPGVAASNGAVHWLAFRCIPGERVSEEHVIVAFNPACHKFEEIPMPDNNRDDTQRDANLALLCGSLSITFTYNNNFEVWLMKESWTKYFVVPTERRIFSAFKFPLRVVPLHITNTGDLILQTNYGEIFIYDQKQKTLRRIEIKCPEPGPYLLGNLTSELFRAVTLFDSLVGIGNNYGRKKTEEPKSSFQGLSRTLAHKSRPYSSTVEYMRDILPATTISSNLETLVQTMQKCLENPPLSSNPPVDSFYELNSSEDPIFVPPSEEIQAPGIPASQYLKSSAVSVQLRSMANDNMYRPYENHQLPWFSDGLYTRTTQPHSTQQHYNFQEQDRHQYEAKHYQNQIPSQMGIGYPNPRLFPVGFFQDHIVQSLIVEAIASIELPIPSVSAQQYGAQGYRNCNPFQDPRNQILIREALANIQVHMPTHSEQLQYNFHKSSPQ